MLEVLHQLQDGPAEALQTCGKRRDAGCPFLPREDRWHQIPTINQQQPLLLLLGWLVMLVSQVARGYTHRPRPCLEQQVMGFFNYFEKWRTWAGVRQGVRRHQSYITLIGSNTPPCCFMVQRRRL